MVMIFFSKSCSVEPAHHQALVGVDKRRAGRECRVRRESLPVKAVEQKDETTNPGLVSVNVVSADFLKMCTPAECNGPFTSSVHN